MSRLRLLTSSQLQIDEGAKVARLTNDADPMDLKEEVGELARIELHFPHFTDGRAYSQAYLIRRRLRFKGDLRATGDVQLDQLMQMERTGFSSAVLNEGLDPHDAARQLERFSAFYQADLSALGVKRDVER
jgi:uncharacterized protein (DUF934 family)